MEGPANNQESFEEFKNRIKAIFQTEGFTENLNAQIEQWFSQRRQESDSTEHNSAEQKIFIYLELAQVYGTVEQYDKSWDCLDDAWVCADNLGNLSLTEKVEQLMNTIHEKKE